VSTTIATPPTGTDLEKASVSWIKAASIRAGKTAIYVAIPFFAAVVAFGQINWPTLLGTIVLAAILSYATSAIAGLPEVAGKTVPTWLALAERFVKTFAQALVAGVGSSTLFQDVHWAAILQASVLAAVASLLTGLVTNLPDTAETALGAGRAGTGLVTDVPVVQTTPAVITTLADSAQPGEVDYVPKHSASDTPAT
jgi:hypothetical protein